MRKENTRSAFSRALARHLDALGMKQVELARKVGRSEAAVSRWVSGQAPSSETQEVVAARLGMTLREFYGAPRTSPEAA